MAIESDDLLVSPAVLLELQHLHETKRVADNAEVVINDLQHRVMLRVCDLPFPDVARRALTLSWTHGRRRQRGEARHQSANHAQMYSKSAFHSLSRV